MIGRVPAIGDPHLHVRKDDSMTCIRLPTSRGLMSGRRGLVPEAFSMGVVP
jgi:hypothetical protein